MKKIVLLAFVLVLLSTAIVRGFVRPTVAHTNGSSSSYGEGKFVFASSKTIWVPDNFTSIQEAVNNASDGDTVQVAAGTYRESLVMNQSLTLVGEDRNTTIIKITPMQMGDGGILHGVIVKKSAEISGFTIEDGGIRLYSSRNIVIDNMIFNASGDPYGMYGIYAASTSNDNLICNNIITNNAEGCAIKLEVSDGNIICSNTITNNGEGIRLYHCNNNTIIGNTITNNVGGGIVLDDKPESNIFHHNNFINNTSVWGWKRHVEPWYGASNIWDDGAEGNYWDNYEGEDLDGDGIGDTPYIIYEGNQDNHPIMSPIQNLPPTADFTYSPVDPNTNQVVHFSDASTDPDGEIIKWLWDFGDGYKAHEKNPAHKYGKEGEYDTRLIVIDSKGKIHLTTKTITVTLSRAPFWMQWWLWAVIAAGIVVLAVAVYFLKKRKPPTPTATPFPPEGTP